MDRRKASKLTPLMEQYVEIHEQHPDALLLFQVGDFYELFFDDAKTVSASLGITLTKRGEFDGKPIPLCGFPIHAIEHYIPKLVKAGFKVALCDQLETATTGKMVRRGVTNVLTPGTLISENLLDAKSNSYLFSFFPTKSGYGLLFSELLTSQLYATVLPQNASRELEIELFRFLPDEVLILQNRGIVKFNKFFEQRGFYTTKFQTDFSDETLKNEREKLEKQFDSDSFKNLSDHQSVLYATILWKKYLEKNQTVALKNFKSISFYEPKSFLMLDGSTQKNLDIIKNSFDGSRSNTLFSFIDKASTSMGSRMIKRWLLAPLVDKNEIIRRQDGIQELLQNQILFNIISDLLSRFGDMERVVGRISLNKAKLQDYCNLGDLLQILPDFKNILSSTSSDILGKIAESISDSEKLKILLQASCNDDFESDFIIKAGYDQELDHMRDLVQNGSKKVLELEQAEKNRTGINSLKIRHNNIHGYYIEVTRANADQIPDDFIEQQALVNRKRYSTKSLQALQFKIIQAKNNFEKLEKEIFEKVKFKVLEYVHQLRISAKSIAVIDCLMGLTKVAAENGYIRPIFNDENRISISGGKHPIVATMLDDQFISNDTNLSDQESLWVITGPNMGGKSTYLRQVALISLLAQIGSFVPARKASLSILDRIFTRIGAGDHLALGKSTFLVEMEETAQICLQATKKSLVILDEVGRGTSTYDGLALAQAVVEYIVHQVGARCLFATHYHELTALQDMYHGIVSYYMDSQKSYNGILFLHKLVRGVADGSFGIEVAKLAQLPKPLIDRAKVILEGLHQQNIGAVQKPVPPRAFIPAVEENGIDSEVVEKLKDLDVDSMTPRQALEQLWDLKELVENK